MRIDVTSTSVAGAVLSVNLARARPNPDKREVGLTGIDKVPTSEPVPVRAPGNKRDGLVGDMVGDRLNHGGDIQASTRTPGRISTIGSPCWDALWRAACSARTSPPWGSMLSLIHISEPTRR